MAVKIKNKKMPNYLSLYMASPHHKARENCPPAFSAASFVIFFPQEGFWKGFFFFKKKGVL